MTLFKTVLNEKRKIRQQMKDLSHQCQHDINESGARWILNGLESDVVMQFGTYMYLV